MSLLVRIGGDIFSFLEVAEWRGNKFEGKHLGNKKTSSGTIATGLLFVFWLFITLLCLLLIFEYLLICLGWIMEATYCLLKHNLAYMFTTVNLSMFCSYCENGHSCI